ncbi:MAG: hypothetical protein ACE5H0_11970 [Bacteroidota bacterium]
MHRFLRLSEQAGIKLPSFPLVLLVCAFAACDLLTDSGSSDLTLDYPNVLPADDSDVSDSLRKMYRKDAARLALRKVNEAGGTASQEVELPQDLVSTLYYALIHVHNATHLASRDSVVVIYAIHTFPYPEIYSLIVGVDSTSKWVAAWRRGERFTGNQQVDALMKEFDLQLDRYYDWPGSHAVTLRATRPLNIAALAGRFDGIDAVSYAEPNGTIGDGNDITARSEASYWQFDYSVGYGDCPSGCIGRHFWTFQIYSDGHVEYAGSSGNPAPAPKG